MKQIRGKQPRSDEEAEENGADNEPDNQKCAPELSWLQVVASASCAHVWPKGLPFLRPTRLSKRASAHADIGGLAPGGWERSGASSGVCAAGSQSDIPARHTSVSRVTSPAWIRAVRSS